MKADVGNFYRKQAKQALEEHEEELLARIIHRDIVPQCMAIILQSLVQEFDWERDECQQLIRSVRDTIEVMKGSLMGIRGFSAANCVDWVEKYLEIDLLEEFKDSMAVDRFGREVTCKDR